MHRIIPILFLACLTAMACDPLETRPVEIRNITVVSDTANFLTARIRFEADGGGEVYLVVEPDPVEGSLHSWREPVIHKRRPENRIHFDIIGLEENTRYSYRVMDRMGGNEPVAEGHFTTAALPGWMRDFLPEITTPFTFDGLILLNRHTHLPSAFYVFDSDGNLVLARASEARISVSRYTPRGTIITMLNDEPGTVGSNRLLETTLAGDTIVHFRYGERGFNRHMRHDVIMTRDHQFLAITESERDGVMVDGLMQLDRNGNLVWQWDTGDDHPTNASPYIQPWGNSVQISENGHYIVSFRRISEVWKIHKDTREVLWRLGREGTIPVLGNDAFLLQHTASFVGPNRLMLFDNGQDRSRDIFRYDEYRPWSRIAFYDLNEQRTQAVNSEFFNLDEEYFAWANGSVWEIEGTYLVGSSFSGHVLQLDQNGKIIGKMEFGDRFYRAELMEDFFRK